MSKGNSGQYLFIINSQCLYCSHERNILHRKHCQCALLAVHLVWRNLRDIKCPHCACSVQAAQQVQQDFQASLHRIYREKTLSASFISADRENCFLFFALSFLKLSLNFSFSRRSFSLGVFIIILKNASLGSILAERCSAVLFLPKTIASLYRLTDITPLNLRSRDDQY